jgi:hypothetical protein
MAIGQLASIGKENNKIYRITIFNGAPTSTRGVHFYASHKIENLSDLKTYVSNFGYMFSGSAWKFIDVAGYYSSSHASKIFITANNDCMLISYDNSQSNLSGATFICSEI